VSENLGTTTMAEGPPGFKRFWDELNEEGPLPGETGKEFRRRIEKQTNLLERLAEEWEREAKKLDFGAQNELERDLVASARTGLDRIRNNQEVEISHRRRRAQRSAREE